MLPPQCVGLSSLLDPTMVPAPKCLSQRGGGAVLQALWGFRAPGLYVGSSQSPGGRGWHQPCAPPGYWPLLAPGKGESPDIDQAQRQEERVPGVPSSSLKQDGGYIGCSVPHRPNSCRGCQPHPGHRLPEPLTLSLCPWLLFLADRSHKPLILCPRDNCQRSQNAVTSPHNWASNFSSEFCLSYLVCSLLITHRFLL